MKLYTLDASHGLKSGIVPDMSSHLPAFLVYLLYSLLRWDYTANSNFLSTQGHQRLSPYFSKGWFFLVIGETVWCYGTVSPSRPGYLCLPHQVYTLPSCSDMWDTSRVQEWVCGEQCECECVCVFVCVCREDSSCMWRQRLSFKRFSSTQVNYITAHCLRKESKSERKKKSYHDILQSSKNYSIIYYIC